MARNNPPANAEDASLIPGSGRPPGEGSGYPLQYSCLENPMDRNLACCNPWGGKESNTTETTEQQKTPEQNTGCWGCSLKLLWDRTVGQRWGKQERRSEEQEGRPLGRGWQAQGRLANPQDGWWCKEEGQVIGEREGFSSQVVLLPHPEPLSDYLYTVGPMD